MTSSVYPAFLKRSKVDVLLIIQTGTAFDSMLRFSDLRLRLLPAFPVSKCCRRNGFSLGLSYRDVYDSTNGSKNLSRAIISYSKQTRGDHLHKIGIRHRI